MKLLKKGYRKVFFGIVSFIWALITTLIVILLTWHLFPKHPEIIAPIIGVVLGFGSSIVLYLFASNGYEHRMEAFGQKAEKNNEQELL